VNPLPSNAVTGRKILVKLGGTLLDDDGSRDRLAAQISAAGRGGARIVVVHGGGKQMTGYLAERGVESRFVDGLRVTTPEIVDALLKVFAGTVNPELIASLNRAGSLAVGLSGIDSFLVEAEQMDPRLGAVGRVTRSNPALLDILTAQGYLPVVACVASDRVGAIYNVNGDQMAAACAGAWGAGELIFFTDVEGVLDGQKNLRGTLTRAECNAWIEAGVVAGGMRAKLTAAMAALDGGVRQVRIAPGAAERVLDRLLDGEPVGTAIVSQESRP